MSLRVAAVIPAHNEESTIAQAIADMLAQSYPVDPIIVVNDCSTDGTAAILAELQAKIPQLVVLDNNEQNLRAGALNRGLDYLRDKPVDLVVAADADSRFDRELAAQAVSMFEQHDRLGGVCTTSGVLDPEETDSSPGKRLAAWFLWRLQRLDGVSFDATRTASWRNVQILHGLCSVFRLDALLDVGGYSPGHLLEDYDLTLRLKKAGWRTMFCPHMKAWTRVPATFRSFFRQRARWMRGGVDVLLEHGINRHTLEDFLHHLLFIILFLGIISHIVISLFNGGWRLRLTSHPAPLILAGAGYAWSLYELRFLDRPQAGDVLFCASLLPRLIVAVTLSYLQLTAYCRSLLRRPQAW